LSETVPKSWLSLGETVMGCSDTKLRVVEAETAPTRALMGVDPLATPVANPPEAMVAINFFEDAYTAAEVGSGVGSSGCKLLRVIRCLSCKSIRYDAQRFLLRMKVCGEQKRFQR